MRGKSAAVIEQLNEKMLDCAERELYESAARWRDAISAIKALGDGKRRTGDAEAEYDVIGYYSDASGECAAAF